MKAFLAQKLTKIFPFADHLAKATGFYFQLAVSVSNPYGHEVDTRSRWVGSTPFTASISRAPYIALLKISELMSLDVPFYSLVMTPTSGYAGGTGYMGGVRFRDNQVDITIGVSKLAQQWDKLFALIILYHAVFDENLLLHHVGYRNQTRERFDARVGAKSLSFDALVRHADDHLRVYFPTNGYYVEEQYFPEGPHNNDVHMDLVVKSPEHFLHFIARAYGEEPVLWSPEENSPLGMFFVTGDNQENRLGIMARPVWWHVEG